MTFTILLTSGGGELMPFLTKELQSGPDPLRVFVVDAGEAKVTAKHASGFWQVPYGNDPHYVERMCEVIHAQKIDLVVPCSDEEALALSAARDEVERHGAVLACAPYETLKTFSNKAACYCALASAGIPTPQWTQATTPEEAMTAVETMVARTGGCVVKPATGRGGRDVIIVTAQGKTAEKSKGPEREQSLSLDAFRTLVDNGAALRLPLIVMERLVAPVHDVDMLAWNGKPLHVVPRRRVNSELPNEGHIYIDSQPLVALGRQLITAFKLSWLYDCDVMFDRDGQPHILEINPRPSGSAAATVAAGVPLFQDLAKLCRGEDLAPTPDVRGKTVIPYKTLLTI